MKISRRLFIACGGWMSCVWWLLISFSAHGQNQKVFVGAPISMNFQNLEVRSALQILAHFTGLNVVAADSVSGSLSLHLQQVPWDQVLDLIAQAKGLSVRHEGNVIWVAPRVEVAARERLDMESRLAMQLAEPLQTRGFVLNYAKAQDVAAQLQGSSVVGAVSPASVMSVVTPQVSQAARMLSARGSVMAEPRTNQLFVTDIGARLEQVAALLQKIDVPLRQVMIEARIVQASGNFGQTLGVRLGGFGQANDRSVVGPTQANVVANANAVAQQPTSFNVAGKALNTSGQFVNLPAAAINGFESASFAVSIFNAAKNRFLNLELSALEADGKGKVVSSPRVVTHDQAKAVIEQGTELPYQISAANGATAITFRKANLKLEVTPQITPEGGIVLNLDVLKDSVGQTTPAGFAIDTKHVNTQVLVEDGGTVMIGGIFESVEQDDTYKVPFLGDIPGLGFLFKNQRRSQSKQELLVFITPKMLSQSASAQ
jgi:type IV pilus assembly protein PilQ